MSQTPEAPLLSPEQVTRITQWHARLLASYEKTATDETIAAAGLGGIGVLLDDMADLLADRAAFRQQVATELAELLVEPKPEPARPVRPEEWFDEGVQQALEDSNSAIYAAAARLGIELPR